MFSRSQRRRGRHQEQGYVLLSLLLMMAVMAIVAATIVTDLKFEIQRDREEEMIHRGVQYSRAVRAYYKKFGRYPANIENLENTNQLRFLRKRYKDPLTGKDFKLLHFGEVKMGMMGMAGGGVIPGASTIGANGSLTPNNPTNSSFGQSSQVPQKTGADSAQAGDSGSDSQAASAGGTNDTGDQGSSDQSGQTFGGLPIVGVASMSKAGTIREFDKKKKYNEWQFVYDPSIDRGFLITTPYQPQLQMFGTGPQNVNGPNTPGQNQPSSFGTPTPATNGFPQPQQTPPPNGNPSQPTDIPNQQ